MEGKIVVPEGMLKAACATYEKYSGDVRPASMKYALEAALRWLSENPIVPTVEQSSAMLEKFPVNTTRNACAEWQCRMFLAPEPKIPEDVEYLINQLDSQGTYNAEYVESQILEAYRRGQRAGKQ